LVVLPLQQGFAIAISGSQYHQHQIMLAGFGQHRSCPTPVLLIGGLYLSYQDKV
jgi:hypothetical protein